MGQTCTEVQLHINHMFSNTEAGDLEVFQNMAGRKKNWYLGTEKMSK